MLSNMATLNIVSGHNWQHFHSVNGLLTKGSRADMTKRKRILRIHINLCSIFLNFPYRVTIISWHFPALHSSFIMPNSFPFFGTMRCIVHCWEPFWFYMWLILHGFGAIQVQLKRTIHRCYIHANLGRNFAFKLCTYLKHKLGYFVSFCEHNVFFLPF